MYWEQNTSTRKSRTQLHLSSTNHYICTYNFNTEKRSCSDNSYKMYFGLGIDLFKFPFQKVTSNSDYISPLKRIVFTLWSLIPNCRSDMSVQAPPTPYFNVYYFFFCFILHIVILKSISILFCLFPILYCLSLSKSYDKIQLNGRNIY